MGIGHSKFTEKQLTDYEENTYFTQKEIIHCYETFRQFDPAAIDKDIYTKIPQRKVLELPELRVNPFGDRVCKVFSSSGDGRLDFEDFLDMMSVFSENAPKEVKAEYAFRIYDFNEDDSICAKDIKRVVNRLCGGRSLPTEAIQLITKGVMEGLDFDGNEKLSFAEFESCLQRAPDFCSSFIIRL